VLRDTLMQILLHFPVLELATVCVVDILRAVSDGSLSWTQRAKLIRYMWVTEGLLLPNKKQRLMNILVSALVVSQRYAFPFTSLLTRSLPLTNYLTN